MSCARHPVIGMPPLERRRDHDARTVAPDGPHERHAGARRVLDRGVGQLEILARAAPDDLRRAVGLPSSQLGRAARPHLALREVEDRGALPEPGRLDQRAAAGELDVVTVRGDGEDGDWLGRPRLRRFGWHRGQYRVATGRHLAAPVGDGDGRRLDAQLPRGRPSRNRRPSTRAPQRLTRTAAPPPDPAAPP